MKQGIFITVEGTDGSGKTTQIARMESYLQVKGYETLVTREPGGTGISEKIRSILLDPRNAGMSATAEMLLYASARAQLVSEVIKPSIDAGKAVICDRFVDSSYAYQGFGRGMDLRLLAEVNRIALDGTAPDITFFFDLSPEIALKRRLEASEPVGPDRIESEGMDFHMRVYNGYVKLAALYPDRIKVIDAGRDVDTVANDVKEWLNTLF